MLDLIRQQAHESQRKLTFSLAHSVAEVTEAQRIRYKVFRRRNGRKTPQRGIGSGYRPLR